MIIKFIKLIITAIHLYLIKFKKDKLDFFIIQYTCNIIANPWLKIIINIKIVLNKLEFKLIKIDNPFVISKSDIIYWFLKTILIILHINIDVKMESNKLGNVFMISK